MKRPDPISLERTALAGGAMLITLRGAQPGPTLALLGGVHGDEDEGVLAVHRVLQQIKGAPLTGTLRAVAPANPLAWAAQRRTNPLDDGDMARAFPGDPSGRPTSILAASITSEVISGATLLIDLHSAGLRYRMPLFCGFARGNAAAERSKRAALVFATPIIWEHADTAPGRSLSVAFEQEIPAIYAECSGGGSIRSSQLDAYVRGVLAVMTDLGMLPASYRRSPDTEPHWVYGGGDLDAGSQSKHNGLFVASNEAGAVIPEGGEIGRIYDYQGSELELIRAPFQGRVMFLRRQARIQVGDVLFALARLKAEKR
jgi:predicted deacylase